MAANKTSRRKIGFIGASYKFVHQAVRDFILTGTMENTDVWLYDIDKDALNLEYDLISRMIEQGGSGITVYKARNRRQALEGADYVVVSVLVGGMDVAEKEDQICRKYNIRHTVGDTIGPMCTARCLRMVPLMLDIARDMKKYCPGAPMLSPTNPMASLTTAVERYSGLTCIGICHGTHFAMRTIAESYGVNLDQVEVNVVGVNHLAFVDRISVKGKEKDLGWAIRTITAKALEGYEDPAGHIDTAEYAIQFAYRTGFLPNNGDHHFIEFFPWFLAPHAFDKKGRNKYGLDNRLHDPAARRKNKKAVRKLLQKWTYGKDPVPDMDKLSSEHIHDIIHGLEGEKKHMTIKNLHLNIPNRGSVPNLPEDAVLEVTVNIDKKGVRGVKNPPLDMFRLGVITPLVAVNELAARAAAERDKKAFLKALHLDPLVHDFDTIPQLAEELWEVNKPYFRPRR